VISAEPIWKLHTDPGFVVDVRRELTGQAS